VSTLRVAGVVAGYGDLTVLRDVSFEAETGQLLVLAGPNGAGKTTLLSCVMGSLAPAAGSVTLDGEEVLGLPIHRRTRMGLGLVPEGRGLFPNLTVWENLRVAAHAARLKSEEAEQGIARAAQTFPIIGERLKQKVQSLSGGEQQMVAFGRALLTDPAVLLLDEPSMGLAPIVWKQVLDTCRALADQGRTIVLVEQRVLEALRVADRAVVLQHGQVVRDARVEAETDVADLTESYFKTETKA
jgi:branched-chain amino acid transport system ATP-binding protein